MPTPHYGQPRYRAIADELSKRIESGVISPGTLLPAEGALAVEFRASRGTIRQAIAVLRETGLVTTEHGRGTCVNPEFTAHISNVANKEARRQREVAAEPELAALFGVEVGATLIEDQYVTCRKSKVEAVVRTYRVANNPAGHA
ncbi:GntR family transcriptional regulator [Micromonospora sp. ATCC 39149]|uniref:GntR family transcriptional regulator n=1 Tax=Micromonospora sp. (strain ATCC 39149 / NRRL 15099 / SCC 1413) TaxID=219305 RepID=UPI0018DC123D|nr:GntR family transcriptional regulator [Micromonospora sp. ATCC 39149]